MPLTALTRQCHSRRKLINVTHSTNSTMLLTALNQQCHSNQVSFRFSLPAPSAHLNFSISFPGITKTSPALYFFPVVQSLKPDTTSYSSVCYARSNLPRASFQAVYVPLNMSSVPSFNSPTLLQTASRKYLSCVTMMNVPG